MSPDDRVSYRIVIPRRRPRSEGEECGTREAESGGFAREDEDRRSQTNLDRILQWTWRRSRSPAHDAMSSAANPVAKSTWSPDQLPESGSQAGFSDGLGDRVVTFDEVTGTSLEHLRFKPEFGDAASFEGALRERVDQLRHLQHPAVAAVRMVERSEPGWELTLVSEHVRGHRLSSLIQKARGPVFALEFLQQITPVMATMQKSGVNISHGAITADRIVFTDEGRLVVLEHVLGSALQSLRLPAHRLRTELNLVVPAGKDPVPLDCRTDIIQIGFVALSLVLGRKLDPSDYPARVPTLLRDFAASNEGRSSAALRLRRWLERTLQVGGRPFGSVHEAHDSLLDLPDEAEFQQTEPAPGTSKMDATDPADVAGDLPPLPSTLAASLPPAIGSTSSSSFADRSALAQPIVRPVMPSPRREDPIDSREKSVGAAPVPQKPIEPVVKAPSPIPSTATPPSVASTTPTTAIPRRMPTPPSRPDQPGAPHDRMPSSDATSVVKPADTMPPPAPIAPPVRTMPPTVAPRLMDSVAPPPAAPAKPVAARPGNPIDELRQKRTQPANELASALKSIDASLTPAPAPPAWATSSSSHASAVSPAPAAKEPMASRSAVSLTPPPVPIGADIQSAGGSRLWTVIFAVVAALEAAVIAFLLLTRPSGTAGGPTLQPRTQTADSSAATSALPPVPTPLTPPATPPPPPAPVDVTPPAPAPKAAAEPVQAPLPPTSRFGGIRVSAPIELQVFEGGKLVGSTAGPIAMLEGVHELDLVNDTLGYRVHNSANVKAGQLAPITVPIPNGRVSINAVPWADVWVDGNPAGQTPLANLTLPIGQHEIVFRHPQFGEQRQTAVVKTEGLTRISANLQR